MFFLFFPENRFDVSYILSPMELAKIVVKVNLREIYVLSRGR